MKLDSNVAGFTTQEKKLAALFVAKTGPNVGGNVNITIQIVSQQCCKTSCRVFVARFTTPLTSCVPLSIQRHFGQND